MDTDEQILDFLSTKENLSFAFEVSEQLQQIKKRLHKKFWEDVECQFRDKAMEIEGFYDDWKIKYDASQVENKWHSISISPKKNSPLYLSVVIEQVSTLSQVEIGYRWSEEVNENMSFDEVDLLRDYVENVANKISSLKSNNSWIGWFYTPWALQSKEFCLQYVENPDVIMQQTVEIAWQFFDEQKEHIISLNNSVANAIANGERLY